MIKISLCMIVKNEAAILSRCLDSVCDLMDEIIIVDTGSTDDTKAVAAKYTDRIYDFAWNNDFSAARNFSFSLANMDYIYAPDADEILNEENRKRFLLLKEALLPEIEIVQMKYRTVSEFNTVLNARTEYRPKLFKRVREFEWIDRSTRRSASHRLYLTATLRFCTCHSPCTTNGIFHFCGRLQQRGDIFCQASQHVCKRIIENRG